jgi:dihydrofolate synthase/folylpolyglutamate synthase
MLEPNSELQAFFQGLQRFGVTLGLARMRQLLDHLGNPQNYVPTIHVTGTNGKGSVCAYLASILTACGYRTGLYTSPHLITYQERIQIDHQLIELADWWRIFGQIKTIVETHHISITEFEAITALMWLYFAEKHVDIAVVEVGLGGRLDATNVVTHPLVTVITSIGLDHQEQLGPELKDIAREKAGILKPNCPLVRGPVPPAAAQVIDAQAQALDCPLVVITPPVIQPEGVLHFQGDDYYIPLAGSHQFINAQIALEVIHQLRQKGWNLPVSQVQQGMAQTRWPGRLQWVNWQGKKILLDGAHNPQAAQVLRQYVDEHHFPPVHWMIGLLQTKDAGGILHHLLRPGDRVSFVPIPGHRYHEPAYLHNLAQGLCPGILSATYADMDSALAAMMPSDIAVVCGSLYLVGQVLKSITPQS